MAEQEVEEELFLRRDADDEVVTKSIVNNVPKGDDNQYEKPKEIGLPIEIGAGKTSK